MEGAVDSGAVAFEADSASFFVAAPDLAKRGELFAIQRRLRACGTEDHANVVAAGPVDRNADRTAECLPIRVEAGEDINRLSGRGTELSLED